MNNLFLMIGESIKEGYKHDSEKAEAILYYLYMMSDGKLTDNEVKIFDELCKGLCLDDNDKKYVIEKCNDLTKIKGEIFNVIVKEELERRVKICKYTCGYKSKTWLAWIIWNLVNLGYADKNYSDEEKKIVSYLVDEWRINKEVYHEIVNTAEIILELKERNRLVSVTSEEENTKCNEKELDSEINTILSNLKNRIKELVK